MIQAVQIFFRKLDIWKLYIEDGLKKLPYAYLVEYWVEDADCSYFFYIDMMTHMSIFSLFTHKI